MEQKERRILTTLSISPSLWTKVRSEAPKQGMKLWEVIEVALGLWLKSLKSQKVA